MNNKRPFLTSDFGLAAYLLMHGMELLGSVRTDESNRLKLAFFDTPIRRDLVDDWNLGRGDAASCRAYNAHTKTVRDALKNPVEEAR